MSIFESPILQCATSFCWKSQPCPGLHYFMSILELVPTGQNSSGCNSVLHTHLAHRSCQVANLSRTPSTVVAKCWVWWHNDSCFSTSSFSTSNFNAILLVKMYKWTLHSLCQLVETLTWSLLRVKFIQVWSNSEEELLFMVCDKLYKLVLVVSAGINLTKLLIIQFYSCIYLFIFYFF